MKQRLLLSPEEAFELLGIGRTLGYKLIRTGELTSFKVGKLRRLPYEALQEWVRSQGAEDDLVDPASPTLPI